MPNIVIDQIQSNGYNGQEWQINGRVSADTHDQHVAYFSAQMVTVNPATINATLRSAGIAAIEAAGAGEVGENDTVTMLGGAVAL
jgi:hypothetical protein